MGKACLCPSCFSISAVLRFSFLQSQTEVVIASKEAAARRVMRVFDPPMLTSSCDTGARTAPPTPPAPLIIPEIKAAGEHNGSEDNGKGVGCFQGNDTEKWLGKSIKQLCNSNGKADIRCRDAGCGNDSVGNQPIVDAYAVVQRINETSRGRYDYNLE